MERHRRPLPSLPLLSFLLVRRCRGVREHLIQFSFPKQVHCRRRCPLCIAHSTNKSPASQADFVYEELKRKGGEEQGTWASRTRDRSEAGCGRPEAGGVWAAKTVSRPPQQPAQPPVCHLLGPADAQTAHHATFSTAPAHQPLGSANAETTVQGPVKNQQSDGVSHSGKRHQQEHRPQRPTESSDPAQHAKGRTGDCPGPRKETTTRRNVTQGEGGSGGVPQRAPHSNLIFPPPNFGSRFCLGRWVSEPKGPPPLPLLSTKAPSPSYQQRPPPPLINKG